MAICRNWAFVLVLVCQGVCAAAPLLTHREIHNYCNQSGELQRSSETCIAEEIEKLEKKKTLCYGIIKELSVPTGSQVQSLKDCLSSADVGSYRSSSIVKLVSSGAIVGTPVRLTRDALAFWQNYSRNFNLKVTEIISAHWSGNVVNGLPDGTGTLDAQLEYEEDSYKTTVRVGRVVVEGPMKNGQLDGPITLKTHPYEDNEYLARVNLFENGRNVGVPLLINRRINQFVFDDVAGTFRDDRMNTIWSRCAVGRTWNGRQQTCVGAPSLLSWASAVGEASRLQMMASFNWRLPLSAEVQSLFPDGEQKCANQAKIAEFLFPNISVESNFKNNHWVWDNNTDDFLRPMSADLRWGTGRGPCTLIGTPVLAHGLQPFVVVREGAAPSNMAQMIPRIIAQQVEIDRKSKAAGDAANEQFAGKVMGVVAEFQKAYAAANSGSSSSGSDGANKVNGNSAFGSWKLVKQYEGGIADFGFATTSTVYVVRCSGGAEHKFYRDKRGLWGITGLSLNASAPTLEEAASRKCK